MKDQKCKCKACKKQAVLRVIIEDGKIKGFYCDDCRKAIIKE